MCLHVNLNVSTQQQISYTAYFGHVQNDFKVSKENDDTIQDYQTIWYVQMKVQHPWRGRVFQYQVMIRLLNYQRHASQGLLRDPSLLRGINMMPSTNRHFLESRPHNMLDQVYGKAPPPQQTITTQFEAEILGEMNLSQWLWYFVSFSNHPFTPFWNPTTFDCCKRRMSRNMTSWLIVKPYSTILRFGIATNVSGSCDLVKKKLEVSSPNEQASNHQPFTKKKRGENTSSNPKQSMNGVFIHAYI